MNFGSDNWAGAHPSVAAALVEHAGGFAPAYGTSPLDRAVEAQFAEIFEHAVEVFFVATGTAANSLSMGSVARPGGVIFAHNEAHMIEDEGGAPGFLSGGSRLWPVPGSDGRINPDELRRAIGHFPPGNVHAGQPMAVSITQATEMGTVYDLEQIRAISAIAREHNLPVHMDGARFANAMVALGCTPAEMTWKAGVDLVSFGATKNGCWCAEAILVLNPALASEMAFVRKRAGQLFSKARFVAAQFDAYFRDDLWLESARHANAMATRLAAAAATAQTVRLAWQPQANEVFLVIDDANAQRLKAAGAVFYPWNKASGADAGVGSGEALYRFVTSFASTEKDIEQFADLLR